jgi:hypothetical protein
VFKNWKSETAAKSKEGIDVDCKMWKLPKFMNKKGEEIEVRCRKLIVIFLDRDVQEFDIET